MKFEFIATDCHDRVSWRSVIEFPDHAAADDFVKKSLMSAGWWAAMTGSLTWHVLHVREVSMRNVENTSVLTRTISRWNILRPEKVKLCFRTDSVHYQFPVTTSLSAYQVWRIKRIASEPDFSHFLVLDPKEPFPHKDGVGHIHVSWCTLDGILHTQMVTPRSHMESTVTGRLPTMPFDGICYNNLTVKQGS